MKMKTAYQHFSLKLQFIFNCKILVELQLANGELFVKQQENLKRLTWPEEHMV